MELALIGVGKMGGAILQGLLNKQLFKKSDILLVVHQEKQQEELIKAGFNATLDVKEAFSCNVIILAIKPQKFAEVLLTQGFDFKDKTIISIAAGISLKRLSELFPHANVVRAMPNTSALINESVTTMCYVGDEKGHQIGKEILSSFGATIEIKEEEMDVTLPLNGSMPAYIYYFIKSFIDAATKAGLEYQTAKELCVKTIMSCSKMLMTNDEDIGTLINNVCSKGGTTIAGLNKLEEGKMDKAIEECFNACMNRSKELNGK